MDVYSAAISAGKHHAVWLYSGTNNIPFLPKLTTHGAAKVVNFWKWSNHGILNQNSNSD